MKTKAAVLLTASTLVACATPAIAPSQAALLEANRRYDAALVAADAAALDQLYMDDFVYIGGVNAEKRNKQQQIEAMTSPDVTLMHGKSEAVEVKQYGDIAIMTGTFIGRVRLKDKEFTFRELFSAVWKYHEGQWLLTLEHGSMSETKP